MRFGDGIADVLHTVGRGVARCSNILFPNFKKRAAQPSTPVLSVLTCPHDSIATIWNESTTVTMLEIT